MISHHQGKLILLSTVQEHVRHRKHSAAEKNEQFNLHDVIVVLCLFLCGFPFHVSILVNVGVGCILTYLILQLLKIENKAVMQESVLNRQKLGLLIFCF